MTKFVVGFIFLLFSTSAFAQQGGDSTCGFGGSSGGSKATWTEILKCDGLYADFPVVDLEGVKIHYHQLCLDGDKLRAQGIHKESAFEVLHREDVCTLWESNMCVQKETIQYEIPLKDHIRVYKKMENGQLELLFEKEYQIHDCQG